MTYDDQLKSDEKHPFWSNPLLYKQGGTTQENTGQDSPLLIPRRRAEKNSSGWA